MLIASIQNVSGPATVVARSGALVAVDATGGNVTLVLPFADAAETVTVQRVDASANTLTVQPGGSIVASSSASPSGAAVTVTNRIVGVTNLSSQGQIVTYTASGSTWYSMDGTGGGGSTVTATTQSGTSYTFALADGGTCVEFTSSSPTTATVPANASVAFPVGTVIEVLRYGSGSLTIAAAGGVTLDAPGGVLTARLQYSAITLRKRATDEWLVAGDLG